MRCRLDRVGDDIREKGLSGEEVYDRATSVGLYHHKFCYIELTKSDQHHSFIMAPNVTVRYVIMYSKCSKTTYQCLFL